jgi:hypothetical protein
MTLSKPQEDIVALVNQGITEIGGIAKRLGKSEGIIRAQLTRIRNAGEGHRISSIKDGTPTSYGSAPDHAPARPKMVGTSSNEAVVRQATAAGQAEFEIPEHVVREFQHQFGGRTDIHPMVLLGVTIQYVKLLGGRLSAHQCIEQVYDALRMMVSDGSPRVGQEQWSAPWPLNAVEAENEAYKRRIAELEKIIESYETGKQGEKQANQTGVEPNHQSSHGL